MRLTEADLKKIEERFLKPPYVIDDKAALRSIVALLIEHLRKSPTRKRPRDEDEETNDDGVQEVTIPDGRRDDDELSSEDRGGRPRKTRR